MFKTKYGYISITGKHITCKAQGKGKTFGSEDGVVQDCVFPFIYKGKKYSGCSKDGKGKWWCATKVDSKGNMNADNWARCNEYCVTDDGKLCISSIISCILSMTKSITIGINLKHSIHL